MVSQFVLMFLATFLATFFPTLSISTPLPLKPPEISYAFGDFLIISGEIAPSLEIQQGKIYIQIQGEQEAFADRLAINPKGEYSYYYSLKTKPLRAFTNLVCWIEIIDQSGEKKASPPATFFYEDNRYPWKTLKADPFSIHWYRGSGSYGQTILDVAQSALKRVNSFITLPTPDKISIYAYANAQELRQTLQLSGQTWIGAHADPDLKVMLLSIPDGPQQHMELERQLPHELVHMMLYEKLGASYTNLPMWLNEGLATIVEMEPNPDYLLIIRDAREKDSFLSIASLCNKFPSDAASAYLAYAESGDFVRFLFVRYGSTQLTALVEAFQDRLDCAGGVELVYNQTIEQLEADWRRQSFGEVLPSDAFRKILPWVLILLTVLVVPSGLMLITFRKKALPNNQN